MSLAKKYSKEVKQILSKYPPENKRSAVMPLLYLAQREEGYINKPAMQDIANTPTGLADQFLDGCAANREKANQMLGRRQHGDVFDAFVVGLAGAVGWALVPGI